MSLREAFAGLRAALERANIRYAVGGSWASTAFGEARFTNDVDILADITPATLRLLLAELPRDFYADPQDAERNLTLGRPFNILYMPMAMKFDIFPASGYRLGSVELDRSVRLSGTGLSEEPAPFVSREDILLAKLHWYRIGGETSEMQWRDLRGLIRVARDRLDVDYLRRNAEALGLDDLLEKLLLE